MIQRLLFDGIDLNGCGTAVSQLEQAAFFYLANETETGLAFADVTVPRAEITMDLAIVHRVPPASFVWLRKLHNSLIAILSLARETFYEGSTAGGEAPCEVHSQG